ncbi:hypothetical protein ACFY1P_10465 [Streptomyces sp. NPDC001407]|uniref:hypothetical protein n=1 Tax=Streptomyces sp. NPDC001407 TaxID=3364573 RepID=UPI0036B140EF
MTNVTSWGTGYRSGALVVDKETGEVGVTQGATERVYTVKSVRDGSLWTAHASRLRIATTEERAKLGIGPRGVN